jgi:uncharacterized membrane protein YedE/YeeE
MANFTPVASFLGGILIGCAAALLWLVNGRIAGISGILGNLLTVRHGDIAWRIAFLLGLICAPWLYLALAGTPGIRVEASIPVILAGGMLVGFGTRLGSGCTSGHGVCGIARLSIRSVVATCLFMATGCITVFVTRHILGG